jgi:parallel beta-helix repeat protein
MPLIANAASLTVCPAGPPVCDYRTIQSAVDAADDGDSIKIAGGVYTDVSTRPRQDYFSGTITQVVYITKSLTLQGGYTTAFTDPPDPEAHPTTLDAQERGRALYVAAMYIDGAYANMTVTVEGLRLTGGNATGLGGGYWPHDYPDGGGVYVFYATAIFRNNQIFSNTAALGFGGGFFALGGSNIVLAFNQVYNNTAENGGGGIFLEDNPNVTLVDNQIYSNSARAGCGIELFRSDNSVLTGNYIFNNTGGWYNGGIYINASSNITLASNFVYGNAVDYEGGGIGIFGSKVTLMDNQVLSNTAGSSGGGGGINLSYSPTSTLRNNRVLNNTAGQNGGGVQIVDSQNVTISQNIISLNSAAWHGGGISLEYSSDVLNNNLITDNQAGIQGNGLYIQASSAQLLNNTIAHNLGLGESGIYVTWGNPAVTIYPSTVWLTNTILVSHTVGISVTENSTATLEATLWGAGDWANTTDWGGAGSISTGTINLWGNPAFVAPEIGDYHLGPGSAAIDAGVATGVKTDLDGRPRPLIHGYDLGAYEFGYLVYLPSVGKQE